MPISPRHNFRDSHTVFLRPKVNSAPKPLILGSKQQDSPATYGTGRQHTPPTTPYSTGPPRPISQKQQNDPERGGDLLVRFGIDSVLGRVIARTLVWLILFQPVYVAMGMELDEVEATPPAAEVIVEEEVQQPVEPVANEQTEVEEVVEDTPTVSDTEQVIDDTEDVVVEEVNDTTDDEPVSSENDVINDVVNDVEGETEEVFDDTETSDEEENTDVDETVDDMGDTTGDDIVDDATPDDGTVSDDTPADDATGDQEGDSTDDTVTDDTSTDDSDVTDDGINTDDTSVTDGTSSDTGGSGNDGTTDTSEVPDTQDEHENNASSSDSHASSSAQHASTTDERVTDEDTAPLITAQNEENKYTFGDGDCTLVAEGEFYCVATGPTRQMTGDPRVYAEKDREGDREIFYFDGVDVKRITNNSYDDFAPVFDEETQRIVWQAMLNDRLQIMLYELETNNTRQITTSRQNSSNPDVMGNTVVWQEWVGTNWEIMLTNVNNSGQEFDIERLTDNAVHDMFPAAYDGLITWQSERGESWEVIVYDLRTGKQTALQKDEDTKYENPRFVLLFDSKHENGDVETIGYDLDTGEMMELGTKSNPIPVNPVTPNDETPDAIPREATSSTQVKVSGREDDTPDDTL